MKERRKAEEAQVLHMFAYSLQLQGSISQRIFSYGNGRVYLVPPPLKS